MGFVEALPVHRWDDVCGHCCNQRHHFPNFTHHKFWLTAHTFGFSLWDLRNVFVVLALEAPLMKCNPSKEWLHVCIVRTLINLGWNMNQILRLALTSSTALFAHRLTIEQCCHGRMSAFGSLSTIDMWPCMTPGGNTRWWWAIQLALDVSPNIDLQGCWAEARQ